MSTPAAIGSKAPVFQLSDSKGTKRTLAEFAGKNVVLYFYPEASTKSCTVEAHAFSDARAEFQAQNAVILGMSPDKPAKLATFIEEEKLDLTLLADEPGADGIPPLAAQYGVWSEKSVYGKKSMGIVRTTFIIGPDGMIKNRWDNVRVEGHAALVLEALSPGASIAATPLAKATARALASSNAGPNQGGKPSSKPAKGMSMKGVRKAGK